MSVNIQIKKFHFKLIFLVLIIYATGCNKNPFDYRTQYIGNYSFTIQYHNYHSEFDTIYNFIGSVKYGAKDDNVQINWKNEFGLNENIFTIFEDGSIFRNNCHGDFLSSRKLVLYVGSDTDVYHIIGDKIN